MTNEEQAKVFARQQLHAIYDEFSKDALVDLVINMEETLVELRKVTPMSDDTKEVMRAVAVLRSRVDSLEGNLAENVADLHGLIGDLDDRLELLTSTQEDSQ